VAEPQSAAASSWEPMPVAKAMPMAKAMPKLPEHEDGHRGNRRKASGVKRLRLNNPEKWVRDGARGGNSNPRVQWWCKRSAAEAQGWLPEFLRTNPKPPKKNDDSHGRDGGDDDPDDARNKKKKFDEHDNDDNMGVLRAERNVSLRVHLFRVSTGLAMTVCCHMKCLSVGPKMWLASNL
jgi:hypothetical protein